ncbi:hypothetical protein PM082_012279 [Marasmius tenuissimus]|nr:hypothetical protein PM082_012279 [Marasmius tenuissimus]
MRNIFLLLLFLTAVLLASATATSPEEPQAIAVDSNQTTATPPTDVGDSKKKIRPMRFMRRRIHP